MTSEHEGSPEAHGAPSRQSGGPVDRERAACVAAVRADVLAGFADLLSAGTFALTEPLAGLGALVDGDFAVVAWELHGVDNLSGFNNLWPTAKLVTVTGVTIVDRRPDPWLFFRQVDWNALNAQLGSANGRSTSPLLIKHPDTARELAALAYDLPFHLD